MERKKQNEYRLRFTELPRKFAGDYFQKICYFVVYFYTLDAIDKNFLFFFLLNFLDKGLLIFCFMKDIYLLIYLFF